MNFLIVSNPYKDEGNKLAFEIREFFAQRNHQSKIIDDTVANVKDFVLDAVYDYVISIGGDGTILRTIDIVDALNIPIIGINVGRCGFIGDINVSNMWPVLTSIVQGNEDFLERHSFDKLNGRVSSSTGLFEDNSFNDIVVGREGFARTISLDLYVNNHFVKNFIGDGIIVSSAIGTTAYNLSLRGPIADPKSESLIITPIAPHSSNFGSLVVSDKSEIKIVVNGRNKDTREAIVSFDGRENGIILKDKDFVEISSGKRTTNLIFTKDYDFYTNLANKIH